MAQRIWRKNAINFQHSLILKLVKYVITHMVKECNKFPALFYLNLLKDVATDMAKKCKKFRTLFHFKVREICRNAYG